MLIERLLGPLPGVRSVAVNVPARTVTVEHDCGQTAPADLVLALNGASLGAYIQGANQVCCRMYGSCSWVLQLLRIAYDLSRAWGGSCS